MDNGGAFQRTECSRKAHGCSHRLVLVAERSDTTPQKTEMAKGEMDNGKWIMDNGKWTVDNGQRKSNTAQPLERSEALPLTGERGEGLGEGLGI